MTPPDRREVDVVVVGSANIDLTARVRRHPRPGETVSGSDLTTSCGGKGANQAVAAARLGARTAFVGRLGTDANGGMLIEGLQADGVDTRQVIQDGSAATGTALIAVADNGENSIVVCPGANANLTPDDVASARMVVSEARVLSLVLEVPIETATAAARTARETGTRVVLNLSPVVALPDDVLALADPLIVNEHEARELLGWSDQPDQDAKQPAEIAAAVRDLGARSAIVTFGGNGAAFADTQQRDHIGAVRVDPVDTTGAGDAFAGTIAWRLSRGDTLAQAVRLAGRVAAYSVRHPGAQGSYPTPSAVDLS